MKNICMGLVVLCVFAGCVSAPELENAYSPWKPSDDVQKNNDIWDAVRAKKADFAKPLLLADLVDVALQNNPASAKAWNDARIAAEQVTYAQGYFMPEVKAVVSGASQTVTADPGSFDSDYSKYGPGLQMNYLVLNFGGGRKAAVEQALQTVYAADFEFNRSIQNILLAVETAYYGMVSAQAGIETAEVSVKDSLKTLEVASEMLKHGIGTELETLQAQSGYDQALYDKANADGLYKTARGYLCLAIGVPADTEIQLTPPAGVVPDAPALQDMTKLIDDSMKRRPDIAALRASLAARQAAIKVAKAAFWPSLYLNGALNQNNYTVASGKEMQDSDVALSGGVSLQWTLFDGFQNTSEERTAIAQADSAKAQLQQAELAASADVWVRYHNYTTALQKYRSSQALLKSASSAHALALDSYKAQLTGILDLLVAEKLLAQTRTQNVAARQEVFTAMANLAYSTGLLEKGGAGDATKIFQK